jgi:hypothetical protein
MIAPKEMGEGHARLRREPRGTREPAAALCVRWPGIIKAEQGETRLHKAKQAVIFPFKPVGAPLLSTALMEVPELFHAKDRYQSFLVTVVIGTGRKGRALGSNFRVNRA